MARQRSPLRVWFRNNFESFSRVLSAMQEDTGVDWAVLISRHIPKGMVPPGASHGLVRSAWVREVEARERKAWAAVKAAPVQPPRVTEHASPQPAAIPPDKPKESGGSAVLDILKRERFD